MGTFSTCILISLLFFISVQSEKKTNEKSNVFVPSKEWKIVKKGQPVPPGLHVRMNLQTGVTEAKLMDDSEVEEKPSKNNAIMVINSGEEEEEEEAETGEEFKEAMVVQTAKHVDGVHVLSSQDGEQTVFANGKLTPQQLQEALKNLDFEDVELVTDEEVERVKEKFRSIEELKEELAELELGMRTEAEEVSLLMDQFLDADDDDEKLTALNELEYIVHHVDAARDLVNYGGLKLIIIPSLNSSTYSLQTASARLVAAAAQTNPTAQSAALEAGVLRLLLRQLTMGGKDSFEENHKKIKASVYAISCVVRSFPAGQRLLVDQGGVSVLAKLFDDANIEIKLKIITLIHDLIVEAKEATFAVEQYMALGWHNTLAQNGWCERAISLLTFSSSQLPEQKEGIFNLLVAPEHDILDAVVKAMLALSPQCKVKFQPYLHTLREISYSYEELAAQELISDDVDDTFYSDMLKTLSKLIASISLKEEL